MLPDTDASAEITRDPFDDPEPIALYLPFPATQPCTCFMCASPRLYVWLQEYDAKTIDYYGLDKHMDITKNMILPYAVKLMDIIGARRGWRWSTIDLRTQQLWALSAYSLCMKYISDSPLKKWNVYMEEMTHKRFSMGELRKTEWAMFKAIDFKLEETLGREV